MKNPFKIFFILCLLFFISLPTTAMADTSDNIAQATFNDVSAYKGDVVEIVVTVTDCPEVKSLAIKPIYDSTRLEYVSGEWLLNGALISDWNDDDENGVILFSSAKNINGKIARFKFKLTECSLWDDIVFSSEIILKNGVETLGIEVNNLSIYINCVHSFSGEDLIKNPTCFEKGCVYKLCTICNRISILSEIDKLQHIPSEWIIVKDATKDEDGYKQKECTICKTILERQAIPSTASNELPQWAFILICAGAGIVSAAIVIVVFIIIFKCHQKKKKV